MFIIYYFLELKGFDLVQPDKKRRPYTAASKDELGLRNHELFRLPFAS